VRSKNNSIEGEELNIFFERWVRRATMVFSENTDPRIVFEWARTGVV
jgi:hypothetical protein